MQNRAFKVPYLRSLRLRALAVVLCVLALPPVFVLGWLAAERGYRSRMQSNAQFSAREARELLLRVRRLPQGVESDERCGRYDLDAAEPLRDVARDHRVRLKLVDGQGRECFDHDADNYVDLSQRAGSVFLGAGARAGRPALGPVAVDEGDLEAARAGGSSTGCRESSEGQALDCYALLKLDDDSFLFVADSAWRPATILNELEEPLLRLTLASAPFAIALAWWLSRRLVRPIEKLREQVLGKAEAKSAAADLTLGGNEVDDLAHSFNQLLASLEQRRVQEARTAADLVHELKNPLAAIRASGEALQKSTLDAEQRARLGHVLEQSSSRLVRLATEFLEMARAEAHLPGESREALDLGQLVAGVCSTFENDARFAGIEFKTQLSSSAKIMGVPHRLEGVVRNLLENAALAAGANGTIVVEVDARPDHAILAITDSGPGIPDDELPRLFERFYTNRKDGGGTGLGLALSRAIVEAHGGTLRAGNHQSGGARFEAKLPIAIESA